MININFLKNGKSFSIQAEEGLSLLEIARINNIDLDGNCDGAMACGTCHVIVGEEWISKLQSACEQEENVLDIIFGLTKNSRLGCQIISSKELDGLEIEIPSNS